MRSITRRDLLGSVASVVASRQIALAAAANGVRLGGPIFLKSEDPAELAREHRKWGYSAAYCPPVEVENGDRIRAIEKAYAAENVVVAEVGAWVNSPATSPSGNIHGMPVAFFCGEAEIAEILPAGRPLVDPKKVYQVGIRSVDPHEREEIRRHGVNVFDMRSIDERGVAAIMRRILDTVSAVNGLLHVSFDVDFLDPEIAPGVGTTVPGGATFREAHLVMEMLSDSGLVSSLDLVELNPFLDDRGKSARVLVEMAASLFGRRIFDRPTRAA